MSSPTDPDAALMLRVQAGETEAFQQIVEKFQCPVINTFHRMIGDRWEAEDLAQQAFVQVFRSARNYRPSAKFSTWLFTIVRNLAINELRRRRRHPADSLDQPRDSDEHAPLPVADPRAIAPHAEALQRELDARVRAAVQSLPEQQRLAIVLITYENRSYEEICEIMDCSLSSLKSLLHRARLTLRSEMAAYLQDCE